MPLIRDTIDPLREREVSEQEALDLERQNARLTGTRATTPDGLRAAAVRQSLQNEAAIFAASERVEVAPTPDDPELDADEHQDQDHLDGNLVEDQNDPDRTADQQES